MAKKQSYVAQINSPQWQRKRLDVFNERGFKCEKCGNDKEQLNVHHKEYQKGKLIWEYPNSELMVLCKSCHTAIHSKDKVSQLSPIEELLLPKIRVILSRDESSGRLLESIFDIIIFSDYGLRFLEDMLTISAFGSVEEVFDMVRFRANFHNLEYETFIKIKSLREELESLRTLQKKNNEN